MPGIITGSGAALPRQDLLGAYYQRPARFSPNIRKILTPLKMPGVSGAFLIVPRPALTQVEETGRRAGAGFSRGNWKPSSDTYLLQERGYEEPVTPLARSQYKNHLPQLDQMTANRAMDIMLRAEEISGAAAVINTTTRSVTTTTGGFTLGHTVSTDWATAASADGALDAKTVHTNFRVNAGMSPNFAAMTFKAAMDLSTQAAVLNRFRYVTAPGLMLPLEALAATLMVPEVIILDEYKNTAKEGQTASIGNIWDDNYVFFGVKAQSQDDPSEPCFGRTLFCDDPGLGGLESIESYGEDPTKQDVFRAFQCIQQKDMDVNLGYLLKIRP